MTANTEDVAATATGGSTAEKDIRSSLSRILSLSTFFVGVGLFAAVGFALHQIGAFSEYQVTYFAVGVAVGVVGLLLRLVAR